MTYRVQFGGTSQGQYHTLPEQAQDALRARVGVLREKPYAGSTVRVSGNFPQIGDFPQFRQTHFGPKDLRDDPSDSSDDESPGILTFYVDVDDEIIWIWSIVWMD